jgi:hypothetical protein
MTQIELNASLRRSLFNLVLRSLGNRVRYAVKDIGVRACVAESYTELEVLTNASTVDQVAGRIVSKTPDALPAVLDGTVVGSNVASLASVPRST